MPLFVVQQTIRFKDKRPQEQQYLKEYEHVGVGFEFYWTKDPNEAILFKDKDSIPKQKNSKRGDWPNFTYKVIPVQIQLAEPKPKKPKKLKIWEEKEQQYNDKKARLFIITDGKEWIPVVTNSYNSIRSDVGNEDHGGMDWEVFSNLCENGDIVQIKKLTDMPHGEVQCYPYVGGSVESFMETCRELIERMDEEGVIH